MLWSSLLLCNDENVLLLIINDDVILPNNLLDKSDPWSLIFMLKIQDRLNNTSNPELAQFFAKIYNKLQKKL